MGKKLYFISFGSDNSFILLSQQLICQCSFSYPRSFSKIYTTLDLPASMVKYCRSHARGFGYWIWKPYIVCDALSMLDDGDILVYIDGRCGVYPNGSTFHWLDQFIDNIDHDIVAWQMHYIENHWTSGALFHEFEVSPESSIGNTGQYSATFHAWRGSVASRRFANEWYSFLSLNASRCRDEPSTFTNHPDFRENRHDQSVFSLLLKTQSMNKKISLLTMTGHYIRDNNLKHCAKPHPTHYQF